mmetsp:Transcript_1853/g.3279  ORF Transcript_1853/g.3279 Transcript_1853/m.3279 type:complete len:106 (-) Transcript_1853:166-483(-)
MYFCREDINLVDSDDVSLSTMDTQCLSSYHWKDIIRIQEGSNMILYFQDCKNLLKKTFQLVPLNAAQVQYKSNVGGAKVGLEGGPSSLSRRPLLATLPIMMLELE